MFYQVEVSARGRSLVQGSPTVCVCVCVCARACISGCEQVQQSASAPTMTRWKSTTKKCVCVFRVMLAVKSVYFHINKYNPHLPFTQSLYWRVPYQVIWVPDIA
jgi:hypothetical protein